MVKKLCQLMLLAVLSCSLILSGCGGQDAEKQSSSKGQATELSFQCVYMESHPTVENAFKPWMAEVEEKTNGSVKIDYFNPNTLCSDKDLFDSTLSGVVDIAGGSHGYTPGQFPLNEVIDLPFMEPSAEAASIVTWRLLEKYPELKNEYSGAKVLFQWGSATYQLFTTNKQVKTLEDLKGMKIISINQQSSEAIRALGANPIEMLATDAYMALQRSMADGMMLPLAPAKSYKITDACKYVTIIDMMTSPFYGVMNEDRFNSLSPEVQKVIEETTGEKLVRRIGQTLDEGAVADAEWMKEQGIKFYVLPDREKERWKQAVQPLHEAWIKAMESKGFKNAREIYNEAVKLSQEVASQTGRGYKE